MVGGSGDTREVGHSHYCELDGAGAHAWHHLLSTRGSGGSGPDGRRLLHSVWRAGGDASDATDEVWLCYAESLNSQWLELMKRSSPGQWHTLIEVRALVRWLPRGMVNPGACAVDWLDRFPHDWHIIDD